MLFKYIQTYLSAIYLFCFPLDYFLNFLGILDCNDRNSFIVFFYIHGKLYLQFSRVVYYVGPTLRLTSLKAHRLGFFALQLQAAADCSSTLHISSETLFTTCKYSPLLVISMVCNINSIHTFH